jgi:cytochrome c5
MRRLPLAALLLALAGPALAEEVELTPGPGADVTSANCAACHTLNYVVMNSPFLDRAGWTAEVNKMINAFHAPIDESVVPEIITYLTEHYGPPTR